MDNIAVARQVVEAILAQELEQALGLVAEDVALTLAVPGRRVEDWGRQAVADYFKALGDIVTFWRVRYTAEGDEVLVLGNECFTLNGRLKVESSFALVFGIRDGVISRLLVIEDVPNGAVRLPAWRTHRTGTGTLLAAV